MWYEVQIIISCGRKALQVANSLEEFEKTTIRELKKKIKDKFPGQPDPDNLSLIFEMHALEDHHTLGFYKITHSAVLFAVMKMAGGGGGPPPPEEVFPRSESMERLSYSM